MALVMLHAGAAILCTLTAAAGLNVAPPITAQTSIAVTPYKVHEARSAQFEAQFAEETSLGTSQALLLLRRRNDILMYGRLYNEYGADTPDYASMRLLDDPSSESQHASHTYASHTWDATMIERSLLPASEDDDSAATPPRFLAMNRFPVREECNALFEERWATRETKLRTQPGFLAFSLLRSRSNMLPEAGQAGLGGASKITVPSSEGPGDEQQLLCYTYSTATLWASEAHWTAWREGGGKSSHDASRLSQGTRTPVSEWMHGKASPVFWDVPIVLSQPARRAGE